VVDFNSRWLGALGADGMVRLAARYNVAQMLERRDFKQRYEAGKPIAVHEFLYPLAQAYDSVFLNADVELGGTDQLFNLNVGRDLMPSYQLEPQIVMTTPLLEGLDGVEKMSKSLGNYVGVTESADDMFGKLMSISDELMWRYYLLLTDATTAEVETMRRKTVGGALHPKQAKVDLAKRIVADFHSAADAGVAAEAFESRFARGELSADSLPEVAVKVDGSIGLAKLVAETGLATSSSEATRKIQQGGGESQSRESDGYQDAHRSITRFCDSRGRPQGGSCEAKSLTAVDRADHETFQDAAAAEQALAVAHNLGSSGSGHLSPSPKRRRRPHYACGVSSRSKPV
jgi:tyrosyl-tRNA synthetase